MISHSGNPDDGTGQGRISIRYILLCIHVFCIFKILIFYSYVISIIIINNVHPYLSERLLSPGLRLTSPSVGLTVYVYLVRVWVRRHVSVRSPRVAFHLARRERLLLLRCNGREARSRRHLHGNHLTGDITSVGRITVPALELIRGTLIRGRYTHICIRVSRINSVVSWNRLRRSQLSCSRWYRQLLTLHLLHWYILSRHRLSGQ